MPSSEISEPSDLEMSKMFLKAIEARRRRRAILAYAIGLLVLVGFWEAWNRGIIAALAVNTWNLLCRIAVDWWAFLQEAFRQRKP